MPQDIDDEGNITTLNIEDLQDLSCYVGPHDSRDPLCPICYDDLLAADITIKHDPCGTYFHEKYIARHFGLKCRCPWCRGCVKPYPHRHDEQDEESDDEQGEEGNGGPGVEDNEEIVKQDAVEALLFSRHAALMADDNIWSSHWQRRDERRTELGGQAFLETPGYAAQEEFRLAFHQVYNTQDNMIETATLMLTQTVDRTNLLYEQYRVRHAEIYQELFAQAAAFPEDLVGQTLIQALEGWQEVDQECKQDQRAAREIARRHYDDVVETAIEVFNATVTNLKQDLIRARENDPRGAEWEDDPWPIL